MYNRQTQSNLSSEIGSMEGKTLKNGWKQYKTEPRKTQALSGKPHLGILISDELSKSTVMDSKEWWAQFDATPTGMDDTSEIPTRDYKEIRRTTCNLPKQTIGQKMLY